MTSPAVQRVRAYFAPVDRETGQPTLFDPAQMGSFTLEAAPAPWVDLGWISDFARKSESKVEAVRSGVPATTRMQVRTQTDATVRFAFETWGKLQLALAAGSQSLNVLAAPAGAAPAASGGAATPAVPVLSGSTEMTLDVGSEAAKGFAAGDLLAVDIDYAGETGYIGSGVKGAYLQAAVSDVEYTRRVTYNVARVGGIVDGRLTLLRALPAGEPTPAMKVSRVLGFCDREGATFFAEWSALFVAEGQQGERVCWYYPRLQGLQSVAETFADMGSGYQAVRLSAAFRALPMPDLLDRANAVCFRSYIAGRP